MIAIVSGSNRTGNKTRPFVDHISTYLQSVGEQTAVIDLENMSEGVLHGKMYEAGLAHDFMDEAARTLREAEHWIYVFPEYNGSFPGALKLFIDALSVRDYQTLFTGKTAALVGTASGRAGNLRGLDHFTAVLHHLGTTVMPQAMPISLIDSLLNEDGSLNTSDAEGALRAYLDRFVAYAAAFAPATAVGV